MTALDYERRILDLEVELGKAMNVAEAARTLATIMRRNCENIDDAIIVAEGWNKRQAWVKRRDDNPPKAYAIEGFMPTVIAVEKALAELTGIDGDDDWYWQQRHPAESVIMSGVEKVRQHLIEARHIMYDEHWLSKAIDSFLQPPNPPYSGIVVVDEADFTRGEE